MRGNRTDMQAFGLTQEGYKAQLNGSESKLI